MVLKVPFLLMLACSCLTLTALAQTGPARAERTAAELAFERAQSDFGAQAARRAELRDECRDDSPEACHDYADMQRKGLGGSQDLAGAVSSYRKACDSGHAAGCAGLAYLMVQGRGVPADPAGARRVYERGCDLGDVSACAAWGNMAYTGTGGPKNVQAGASALNGACEDGYDWACDRLRSLGVFEPGDRTMERLRDLRRN